uniref:Putative RNA-directed DNA polymerase n=1 Tax=Tanacetum cinerariifolium TaxID=118510 RepID=A0A699HIQ8_TANCI|nr:putative RNA-directed DNA polymerase [Tanacetum cinerariifolium]
MEDEMRALEKNKTWETCVLPLGKKTVGCRWVFTIKYNPDDTIERYNARLVAKGYTQTYSIDYSETFSPVAKINTIRVLFSVAANKEWPLYQFDVKNAFLHGELKEEVYMEAPQGFTDRFTKGEVCLLKKSLYGLKQSPRAWFGRFTLAMNKYGFKQSNSDHTLFLKRRGNLITCLIIYVDDMIITGDDKEEIAKLRKSLFTEFEMKDLGKLKYFLGIEVLRSKRGIFMCQKKYILDLLAETGMVDCKQADTPMIMNQKLYMEEEAEPAEKERYQRMVGKLIYLSHTRPDIAYAVGVVSQFMHQPQKAHMVAALRMIRYLKGTTGHGVLFQPNGHLETQMFTDANWAGNKSDRRSTSGYFTLVGGNLVTWKSKKQKVVALSSAEAEFRGIARGITEVLWVRRLLTEIGYTPQEPTKIFSDNKAAIQISENLVQHDRTKHIEVDRYLIKEKLEAGIIKIPFVKSEDQLVDILTKAVGSTIFNKCLDKLNFGNLVIQLEGEGITEVLWVRRLLTEIGYSPQEPTKIFSDNKAAIQISENPVQHDRTKHIEVDRHFIKEKLEAKIIALPFVRSKDQLADILTKAVNEKNLHECLGKLNFINPEFVIDVMLLPLNGCDMVLRIQWLSTLGVATDETKIEEMKQWPAPSNLKQLRGFLGMTGERALGQYSNKRVIQMPILRGYFLDMRIVIKTDHFSLKYLLEQRITTPAQMKWLPKLMGFDYKIMYKKGSESGAADALSRVDTSGQLLQMGLSTVTTDLLPTIVESWSTDPILAIMIKQLIARKLVSKHYSCSTHNKRETGLSMDFVEGLSNYGGKTVIMVVVDILSKYSRFMALRRPFTAIQVSQLFLDNVYKLHGLPKIIVSDGDKFSSACLERTFQNAAIYGQPPSSLILYYPEKSNVDSMDRSLTAKEAIIQMLQFHLARARARMKAVGRYT